MGQSIVRGSLAGALTVFVWVGSSLGPASGAQSTFTPDFGLDPNTAWVPERGDNFLPPPSGPGPVVSDPGFPLIQSGLQIQDTDRIADLTNPILQTWAREKLKTTNDRVRAGLIPFVARERCWPGGVPGFLVYALFLPIRFFQTPTQIVMVNDLYAQVRHVYMNVSHTTNVKPSWYGESVGHWEGDALVVDTIGLSDRTSVDNFGTPHTEKLHVVERFKLIENGAKLEATINVEDPDAFNSSWSAVQIWRRTSDQPLIEHPCEEINATYFGYDVVPIPRADTPDF